MKTAYFNPPLVFDAAVGADPMEISPRSLASGNYNSPSAIVRHCFVILSLVVLTPSRPTCDGRTNEDNIIYRANIALRDRNSDVVQSCLSAECDLNENLLICSN